METQIDLRGEVYKRNYATTIPKESFYGRGLTAIYIEYIRRFAGDE